MCQTEKGMFQSELYKDLTERKKMIRYHKKDRDRELKYS